jgi:hypothetical protein
MYGNLEKLPALRNCYDLGGCVTVKITSIQGSGRLAFCSATDTDLADDEAFKIFSYYTAIVVWGNPVHAPSPLS